MVAHVPDANAKPIPFDRSVLTCTVHFSTKAFSFVRTTAICKTSLCKALTHPARFDGKRVEFHAKYFGTFEGTWITDTECAAAG